MLTYTYTIATTLAHIWQVYETVASCISKHPEFDTIRNLDKSKFWAVVLGFEHERIHLETSAVLIRELPIDLVQRPEFFPPYHPSAYTSKFVANPEQGVHYPNNEFLEVDSGDVTLGKPRNWPTFGWDNEYGEKKVTVAPFAATKFKISNGEYLEFVRRSVLVCVCVCVCVYLYLLA
jgi:formylglycine-generating enzyme required for sulfatase activity